MGYLEHVAKELAGAATRGILRAIRGRTPVALSQAIESMHANGYAVIEGFWSAERCLRTVERIDQALDSESPCYRWTDDERADQRLYCAETLGGEFADFFSDTFVNSIRKHYSGVSRGENLLLAARLDYVMGNKGSGGGWHRDSPHRTQFKSILYLTDVDSTTGPFEYVVGSHSVRRSLELVRKGLNRPNQYRFEDPEIENLQGVCGEIAQFCGPAGTLLLVDSKGIHRGRPIERGQRYALTKYFLDGKRPRGFLP